MARRRLTHRRQIPLIRFRRFRRRSLRRREKDGNFASAVQATVPNTGRLILPPAITVILAGTAVAAEASYNIKITPTTAVAASRNLCDLRFGVVQLVFRYDFDRHLGSVRRDVRKDGGAGRNGRKQQHRRQKQSGGADGGVLRWRIGPHPSPMIGEVD